MGSGRGTWTCGLQRAGLAGALILCALALGLSGCALLKAHTVPSPDVPEGPASGEVGQPLSYTVEGGTCSRGHDLVYRFDWDDGTYSDWDPTPRAIKIWNAEGAYEVRAQARCARAAAVVSGWSSLLIVSVAPSAYGGVGETRDNGRLAITLRGVRTATWLGGAQPDDGRVFLVVDIEGTALRDIVHLIAEAFAVVQADGETFQRSGASVALPQRLETRTNMYTGQSASGELAFEVCPRQEHYVLDYDDGWGPAIRFRFEL